MCNATLITAPVTLKIRFLKTHLKVFKYSEASLTFTYNSSNIDQIFLHCVPCLITLGRVLHGSTSILMLFLQGGGEHFSYAFVEGLCWPAREETDFIG